MWLRYAEDGIAVLETPPCRRTITARECKGRGDKALMALNHYYLAFPWLVFTICYNRKHHITLHLAFRNESLRQRDQSLFYPNLWNVYHTDLRICMESVYFGYQEEETFFKAVISSFWNSAWTQSASLHDSYLKANSYSKDRRLGDAHGPNWKTWEQYSKSDPNFITTVCWPRYGVLDDLLRYARLSTKNQSS